MKIIIVYTVKELTDGVDSIGSKKQEFSSIMLTYSISCYFFILFAFPALAFVFFVGFIQRLAAENYL
jgi:hypothetical protein